VNLWDSAPVANMSTVRVDVIGEQSLHFKGTLDQPAIVVDMRIYTARLLEQFASRGGRVVVRGVEAAELDELAAAHDLLIICTGRGGLGALFPRIAEHSPFTQAPRFIMGGLFRGVDAQPHSANFTIVPGVGELFCFPIYTFEAGVVGLGMEAIPGGPIDAVARMSYEADPAGFHAAYLEALRTHAPAIAARIDPDRFELTRPLDLMQGSITPVVRRGYTQLPGGRYALALGDAHILNDPILGQGANTASKASWMLGEAIMAAGSFDEAFCRSFEERVWGYAGPVTAWNNAMLQPPPQHMVEFMVAASMHQPIGDMFVNFLSRPVSGWETFSSPDRTASLLRSYGWQGMPQPMAAAAD
jgi:hypothetical protein